MQLPADLRLALLELTHLLDSLARRPLPMDENAARELARFNIVVLLTLSKARDLLDDRPIAASYDLRPPVEFPTGNWRERLHLRAQARAEFVQHVRRPHP